ncbi:MAG: rhomboid family intramembrane serine protease, partial [Pseudobdellovibrio sp.]
KLLIVTCLFYSFGDNVEDRIGKFKFVLLILFTHLANTILLMKFYGAQSGITIGLGSVLMATMTCYSLIYPNYKIYMNRYWRNFRVNLQLVIFGTLFLDVFFAALADKLLGVVSLTTNTVGVVIGAVFYFAFCEEKTKKST